MENSRKKYLRQNYISRVNKVIDYIEKNIKRPLGLKKLAKIAGFSPFHFHRIFSVFVGETLNSFIKRLRAEKAAMMLDGNPKYSITEVAFGCGFSSSQSFARDFKEYFGVSPSEFRNKEKSKIRDINSKNWKDLHIELCYNKSKGRNTVKLSADSSCARGKNSAGVKINMEAEVKDLSAYSVAYVRNIGPYKGNSKLFEELFGKLCGWAGPKGLMNEQSQLMSVYYDDPKVTDEDKLRLDICLVVPEDTEVEGEIGKQTLPAGKFAVARVEIKEPKEYEQAWDSIYRDWLPESGYEPDSRPCYEIYRNDSKKDPEGKQIIDLCIPVKPA